MASHKQQAGDNRAMKTLALMLAILTLTSCTMVRYQSTERTLTVIDLHPGGESITLSGAIQDTATLDVNREQGSNAEIIGAAVDAAIGL